MHLVQRACVSCPSTIPECSPACGDNEQCSFQFQTCDTCSTARCTINPNSPPVNKGPNVGAIVGGLLAALVLVGVAFGYRWYRARRATAAAAALKRATFEPKPDIVASAHTVLNRPDPNINIVIEKANNAPGSPMSGRTFEDGSPVRFEAPENPFSDHASIATASDRATNVIPIGLITPSSASALSRATGLSSGAPSTNTPESIASSAPSGFTLHPPSESPRSFSFAQNQPNAPMRPQRGPDIDMRLDLHRSDSTASHSTLLPPNAPYAASSRTGVSGISSRSSVLSTSSSFLNEAPQIVTPNQANFRQVLGVQRAAVVQLGSSPASTPAASAAPSIRTQKSSSTIGKSASSPGGNPFGDHETELNDDASTFHDGRPMSSMSDAASIANIASARRVQFMRPQNLTSVSEGRALLPPSPLSSSSGMYSPTITGRSLAGSNASTPTGTPRAVDFRTAGQLTPPSQAIPRSFDDMMGAGPPSRPSSLQSFAMTNRTSTADSILESFPFVPPSPISMHHAQPHPSTLQQQQQQQQQQGSKPGRGPSSLRTESTQGSNKPGRMTLGLSTVSSASSGLGAFPFQFEGGDDQTPVGRSHASTVGPSRLRHQDNDGESAGVEHSGHGDRASLDTLQLSRDLADFPLPHSPGGPSPRR